MRKSSKTINLLFVPVVALALTACDDDDRGSGVTDTPVKQTCETTDGKTCITNNSSHVFHSYYHPFFVPSTIASHPNLSFNNVASTPNSPTSYALSKSGISSVAVSRGGFGAISAGASS